MISEIIMKHLWDKGQMWPLFTMTAAYAMNTEAFPFVGKAWTQVLTGY